MRRTILLAGVVSFVMAFLGTVLALLLAGPAVVGAQEARIRAEQFIVVGDNGADRIQMQTGPGLAASFNVKDTDGTDRVRVGTGSTTMTGGAAPEAAGFTVFASDRTRLVRLGTGNPGIEGENRTALILSDRQGHGRLVATVAEDGTPSIQLLDANGNVTWSAAGSR